MLILNTNKYEYEGTVSDKLYRFRRRGKNEWIVVDSARLIDSETGFVKYFDSLLECEIESSSLKLAWTDNTGKQDVEG